jgi:hypothetical protein
LSGEKYANFLNLFFRWREMAAGKFHFAWEMREQTTARANTGVRRGAQDVGEERATATATAAVTAEAAAAAAAKA